jgi:hypothetical protein
MPARLLHLDTLSQACHERGKRPQAERTEDSTSMIGEPTIERCSRRRSYRRVVGGVAAAFASLAVFGVANASASFGIAGFDGQVTADSAGTPFTQAGGHPFAVSTQVAFNTITDANGHRVVDENPKNVLVNLPPGLIGDPSATPKCPEELLEAVGFLEGSCPDGTQVGVIYLDTDFGDLVSAPGRPGVFGPVPVYNVEPPPGVPAEFGFNINSTIIHLVARVRSGGDYGLSVDTKTIPQTLSTRGLDLTLWGVPADPSHDAERGAPQLGLCNDGGSSPCSAHTPRKAFLTLPTSCSGPQTTTVSADSWQHPGAFEAGSFVSHDNGTPSNPIGVSGCDRVPFDASLRSQPSANQAGAPAGWSFDVRIPQNDNPDGLAQAHLRKAVVTLPEGVAISPSAASGLQGCSDAQAALKSTEDPTCPEASKIGTVTIDTPLLSDPMQGSIYLGTQASDDPASGQMYRVFLVARGPGVIIKLPGSIVPDQTTGRLIATFDNNPQLPFSNLHLTIKGGPRAALLNPVTCGTKTTTTELSSWSGKTVTSTSSFDITGCGAAQFAPSFNAGSSDPAAGRFSPFVVSFTRSDADKELSGLSVHLPKGLLAKVAGVPLCPDAQAGAGTCDASSRVGSATVGSGPGASPLFLTDQPVYLTGPYKGGPYGLAVVIRAVAGPFDLGTVVVRQSVRVDPNDASLTVVSDPFPTILKGVPLKIRRVDVNVDRPGFTTTPTSCAAQAVTGTLTAVDGTAAAVSSRYQAADCQALGFAPKMAMQLTNKSQTTDGKHPGLDVLVTQGAGQANLKNAVVKLPLSLALDPEHSKSDSLCSFTDGLKDNCPLSSEVGTAEAVSPLLNKPLYGKVYFVKGLRLTKQGHLVRSLPTLLIPLRGEINLDLRATSAVDSQGRLVTTFANIPDATLSGFRLQLRGGKKGILVVTGNKNLCRGNQVTNAQTDGQNGKTRDFAVTMKTPCGSANTRANTSSKKRS